MTVRENPHTRLVIKFYFYGISYSQIINSMKMVFIKQFKLSRLFFHLDFVLVELKQSWSPLYLLGGKKLIEGDTSTRKKKKLGLGRPFPVHEYEVWVTISG